MYMIVISITMRVFIIIIIIIVIFSIDVIHIAFCLWSIASCPGEDGTMGILRGCCDLEANSGDFFGPKGMGGLMEGIGNS